MFKLIFVATLLALVNCQDTAADSTCNQQPIIQNICGSSEFPAINVEGNNRPNVAQGRPGRIGPKGLRGFKGSKGERGQADDTREELERILSQLDELRRENNKQQEQIEELKDQFLSVSSPTCAHALHNKANLTSGFHSISLQGLVIQVYCNFSGNQAETIIHHNFPNETDAGDCEPSRCARHAVTYDVTMKQIMALIEQSAECRQFIKYRCISSFMFRNENPTYAAWLSSDGTPQIYWGGATSRRDRYCACGETNSCVDNNYKCNCDVNSNPETSDEGFLTDKDKLPVTGLQFGNLGDSGEAGWFTLGPLICSGRAD